MESSAARKRGSAADPNTFDLAGRVRERHLSSLMMIVVFMLFLGRM
jgi:hypothetical protein